MRRILLLVTVALLMAVFTSVANAQPAEESPVGGEGAHPHHVNTGSGCKDIDSVTFEPDDRGLHRGSDESGPERGPFHGSCE